MVQVVWQVFAGTGRGGAVAEPRQLTAMVDARVCDLARRHGGDDEINVFGSA
ncbi:hypothetical protein ACIRSS_23530 [Amycolatopsis sp. NPDC101161]|uniref:hypothetical protein n=1 Tax=Amycolatopsis sp. NPDC101161 TaxID=3363940 RepID=UPI003825F826